ncbi:MaoC family dehydratase [Ottowia sp.]|uniref:MaoC family dehydratase n=1 Tax=Ottowia sp. TaxID=1898956 RepID=UPI003A85FFCB
MRIFQSLDELVALTDQDEVVSDWFTVTQQHIDQFADATGDHQWIHVDAERAKAGPFGTTVAHGYLTLSLLAGLGMNAMEVKGVRMGINYGLNKVRFMAPVPVGSRLRARFTLLQASTIEGGMQLAWRCTIEREGADKPVCVAEPLSRYYI